MSPRYTKGLDNPYCMARLNAAKHDDGLAARRHAASKLNIDESTLARYELGTSKVPLETVVAMSDLYKAPELINMYCSHDCPIGCGRVDPLEVATLDRLVIKVHNTNLQVGKITDDLLVIAENGVISDLEKPIFFSHMQTLRKMKNTISELLLYAEKAGIA